MHGGTLLQEKSILYEDIFARGVILHEDTFAPVEFFFNNIFMLIFFS